MIHLEHEELTLLTFWVRKSGFQIYKMLKKEVIVPLVRFEEYCVQLFNKLITMI